MRRCGQRGWSVPVAPGPGGSVRLMIDDSTAGRGRSRHRGAQAAACLCRRRQPAGPGRNWFTSSSPTPRWWSTGEWEIRSAWSVAEQLGAFIGAAVERFEFFEFVILNAHIVFPDGAGAGTAVSRLFMCELRQESDGGRWTHAYGLYHDRYRFESGRWRFSERRYHSLARHGRDLDAFPLPDQPGIEVPGIGA